MPPSAGLSGLKGRCPRCGKGPLFKQAIVVRDRCASCDLSYGFADAGDGPAIFAIFILGFVVLGGALIAEFKYQVPVWFHVVAWGVSTPLLALGLIRVLKGLLIAQQFSTKAEQGRIK
jgi:uncharacterized protein (DUF983 family)